jgi:hypothetical protein
MSKNSEITVKHNGQIMIPPKNTENGDNSDITLDNRLPVWINKFVILTFLVAISVPLALLNLIRQPVYKEQSFTGVAERKNFIINSGLSSEISDNARVGQKLDLVFSLSGSDEKKKQKITATIQSVEINKTKNSCTLMLTSEKIDRIAGDYAQINPEMYKADMEGMILFKTRYTTVFHKIFR